tara:strand:+ start:331 stop:495 length:165 start_codon:yes stop_codon:yes gene_type:complete
MPMKMISVLVAIHFQKPLETLEEELLAESLEPACLDKYYKVSLPLNIWLSQLYL